MAKKVQREHKQSWISLLVFMAEGSDLLHKPPDDEQMVDIAITIDSASNNIPKPLVQKSQSFREAVQKSSQWFQEARKIVTTSTEWEDGEDIPPDGDLSVQFNKVTLEKIRSPWKLTIMGKCLGLTIKPSFMETRVRAMWRVKGALEVIDIGKNVYLFRFTQSDDYEKALLGGPWFILDHYLMLTP